MKIIRSQLITGFDPNGEPEVQEMSDGSIQIMFNFMPPLDEDGDDREEEIWDSFDEYLGEKLGLDVIWEDRELFLINNPKTNTFDELVTLLTNFTIEN